VDLARIRRWTLVAFVVIAGLAMLDWALGWPV